MLFPLCSLSFTSFAQWSGNPAVNNAICAAANNQSVPAITSDGSGGAIIAWADYRGGTANDIYAQRISSGGTVQWAANGVAICTAVRDQSGISMLPDGSGGAFITWHDERPGAVVFDVYAQRINAAGAVQWAANGVAICTAANNQRLPKITSDGGTGAIITWYDNRAAAANYDIYAQKINAAGAVQWAANGVAVCTAANSQYSNDIVADGSGGAIITWYDFRGGAKYDIYARLINNAGTVQWAADGVPICTAADDQTVPTLVSDGSGGAIITWQDIRSVGTYDIYAQRINNAGAVQWAVNGVVISTALGHQNTPNIISDGSGGAIITWEDGRNGWQIYAQRINNAGVVQWAVNGAAICTDIGSTQRTPTLTSDGSGGAIIAWKDDRNGTDDIYAQRINAAGTVEWTVDGEAVCIAANTQSAPKIVSSTAANAIIAWQDLRGGATTDIYAQGINAFGKPLPVELLSFEATVNDQTQVELNWITATEMNNDYFTVEKTQDGQNFQQVAKIEGTGNSSSMQYYYCVDKEPYSGVSYYRLKQTDMDGKFSYSQLVSVDIKNSEISFEVFPSPAFNTSGLNLNVKSSHDKEVLIVIQDILGNEHYSKIISVNKGGHIVPLEALPSFEAGCYLIIASSDSSLYKKKLIIEN